MINFKEFAKRYLHPKPSEEVLKKIEEIDRMRDKGYEIALLSNRRSGKSISWRKDLKTIKNNQNDTGTLNGDDQIN